MHVLLIFPFMHLSLMGILTMAGNLTDEQCKWILKQYLKTENSEHLREQWIETFSV